VPLGVIGVMAVGFTVRLVIGMRTPLDPSEATLGLTALHIVHGQLYLMDPDGQYFGATDAYAVAPFIAVFGASVTAVRLALAFAGALSVLGTYWFGRIAFRSHNAAIIAGAVVAVFPLFTVYWSSRLHPGAGDSIVLETVCLSAAALIGWGRAHRLRWWAVLGLASGIALWSDLLFVCVVVAIAVVLLLRAPRVGWGDVSRGAGVAAFAGVVGMLPWLVYNIPHGLPSLHAIPRTGAGIGAGVANLVSDQLPILLGGTSSCGHAVIPAVVTDIAFAALVVVLLWTRRRTLQYLVAGHWTGLSQIDLALLVIPATLVTVVLAGVNANACVAQNLVPMAVPLALGVASILAERGRLRRFAVSVAAIWLVISAIAAAGTLPDAGSSTVSGTPIPGNLSAGIAMLEQHHPGAIWAEYSLSRLLSFASRDTLPIGEYGGDVGFLARQQQVETALDPSWVFVAGDPRIATFLQACGTNDISYATATGGGLVLYTDLTGSLEPGDVFSGGEGRTS
jgi:4-amino-4-deoxy-L-arabinose transferase-like glycosyltransferase